jgi:RimJ/RimL family protein N-acetyltransferase
MTLDYPVLEGRFVRLEPLAEQHKEGLRAACDADQEIWDIYPYSMAGEHFDPVWTGLLARRDKGLLIPYAVVASGEIVGISCIFPDLPNRTAEIGGTYYRPDVRGTAVNPESKRLLMAHLFDSGAIRVGYKVDAVNARSRAAVLKLGAHQDGILRAERITWTGRVRDTVVFSILAEEWPEVRDRLDQRLG